MTSRAMMVFGLMSSTYAAPEVQLAPGRVMLGHTKDKPKPEPVGCKGAACRTLDHCLCSCSRCRVACKR